MNKNIEKDRVSFEYIKLQIKNPTAKTWRILKGLLEGEKISSLIAFEKYNSMSLATIISMLRKELNIPIEPNMQKKISFEGRIVRYAQYRITPSHLQEERERFGVN